MKKNNPMALIILRFLIIPMILFSPVWAEKNEHKNDILYTNLIGAGIITAWGAAFWEYGKSSPHAHNEGWFGKDTKYGGADKLGHFYASYLLGSSLCELYKNFGYHDEDAIMYGSLSSFFLMNAMEVGDSFSAEQGFSYEDFIMNTLGALSSYAFYTYPELSKRIDLRIEYIPSFKTADVVTEYDNMKYLVAIKAEGFDFISNPWLRYGELQVGYYTRNYKAETTSERDRILYLGIGINFSKIARQNGYSKTAGFLNYYQLPYTYAAIEKNLNK